MRYEYCYYVTPHERSRAMGDLISKGFTGDVEVRPAHNYHPDSEEIPIVYGILRGCDRIIKDRQASGRPFIYIDHAYFHKCRDLSFRMVIGGRYWKDYGPMPSDRWERLGIELKPITVRDSNLVIIVPMSPYVAAFEGAHADIWLRDTDADIWLRDAENRVNSAAHLQAVILDKSKASEIESLFARAYCMIAHESTLAISALINAVPCITSLDNPVAHLRSYELFNLYCPSKAVVESHFSKLAYQQFTIEEIQDGTARRLLEQQNAW